LQTDEEAVNLAAVVALRDAGAHFIATFGATPDIALWLDGLANQAPQGDLTPGADAAPATSTSDESTIPEAIEATEETDGSAEPTTAVARPVSRSLAVATERLL